MLDTNTSDVREQERRTVVMGATHTPLSTLVKRWSKALADAACGPLVVAQEVCEVASRWHEYLTEAGGVSCSEFLRMRLGEGKDLAFFQRRADAVVKLGEHVRRTWHHDAAVWVANATRDPELLPIVVAAVDMARVRANGGVPLTVMQVRRVAKEYLGTSPTRPRGAKHCARCARLEAALIAAGGTVPD